MPKYVLTLHYTAKVTEVAVVEGDDLDKEELLKAMETPLLNELTFEKAELVDVKMVKQEVFLLEEWPYEDLGNRGNCELIPTPLNSDELERLNKSWEESKKREDYVSWEPPYESRSFWAVNDKAGG